MDGSPLLPPQASSSRPTPPEHPQSTAAWSSKASPSRPTPWDHPAAPSPSWQRETEARRAFQLAQSCGAAAAWVPCQQEAGGSSSGAGLPCALFSAAPCAHSPHVISCSFFAPPMVSAAGSVHGRALPPLGLTRGHAGARSSPSGWQSMALPGRFGNHHPWAVAAATHGARGGSGMRGTRCCISRSGFESDLYVPSRGISGPDSLHRVRRPPARAQGGPAPTLGVILFYKSYGPVSAREFQTMERHRVPTEGKK